MAETRKSAWLKQTPPALLLRSIAFRKHRHPCLPGLPPHLEPPGPSLASEGPSTPLSSRPGSPDAAPMASAGLALAPLGPSVALHPCVGSSVGNPPACRRRDGSPAPSFRAYGSPAALLPT